jgi:hypothetical protein
VADRLVSARWKIWNAHQHLNALDSAVERFLKSRFYTVVMAKQDRKGRLPVAFGDVADPPPEIGLLIGDCAHNLRAALDYIAWAICKPRNEAEENNVQFPIASSRTKLKGMRWRLPQRPRGAWTVVESVQPYHRRKWPESICLKQLQAIDNRDKHRILNAAAVSLEGSRLDVRITGNTSVSRIVPYRGRVKAGAVIARLEMGYSEVGAKVTVNPVLSLLEVFDDAAPKEVRGLPIRKTLGSIGDFIENEVLPRFERFV